MSPATPMTSASAPLPGTLRCPRTERDGARISHFSREILPPYDWRSVVYVVFAGAVVVGAGGLGTVVVGAGGFGTVVAGTEGLGSVVVTRIVVGATVAGGCVDSVLVAVDGVTRPFPSELTTTVVLALA